MTICLALAISLLFLGVPRPSGTAFQDGVADALPPPSLPQILAFDLPVANSQADLARIRGFIVGYFQGDSAEPRWVLDVSRDLTRIGSDGRVRILLPLADLPVGLYSARIKIRTESVESDWSAPSPPFSLPELSRRRPRRSKPPAAKPQVALNLEPALASAVRPLLPKGVDLAEATRGFQKPMQFLHALFAARNLGIALADLKANLFEKPGKSRSLSSALADLRPDRDAKAEARKALKQARSLAAEAGRKRRMAP